MPDLYTVILAGGSGTRFWPLSRRRRPKQLLPLVGEDSLLRAAQKRLTSLVPIARRLVITHREQADAVLAELDGLIEPQNLLREPVGRDTAAAVILGALAIRWRDPDGVMAVLPADHVIEPAAALVRTLAGAAAVAAAAPTVVTIGVRPDHPATGYGYIQRGEPTTRVGGLDFFRVDTFREKPDLDTARRYLADGRYYWNSGIFVWSAATLLALAGRFLPSTLARLEPRVKPDRPFPGPAELRDAYGGVEKISVDYAILERAPRVEVVEAPFTWDDVGAWTAIENHLPRDEAGNAVRGAALLHDVRGTTVHTEDDHLVAALGLDDVVIVHTPDATLVARKTHVQQIKEIVRALRETGREGLT